MANTDVAEQVLDALGGKDNVKANDICMTRLRILTEKPGLIDLNKLRSIRGVLGTVRRGSNGVEIVFGPGSINEVSDDIVRLTGIEPSYSAFRDSSSAPEDSISVQINGHAPIPKAVRAAVAAKKPLASSHMGSPSSDEDDDASDMEELASLLEATGSADSPRLLVVNGPNINMLGVREPKIYGRKTYADLVRLCRSAAQEAGFSECRCFQSNHEGDLVDVIQAAYGEFDGIVINPAAYTHTSVALLDALKSVALPTIEVHISKVDEREDFRQISYVRAACFETIVGMGLEGYRKAIKDMAAHLREHRGAEKG
ncbi:3-dehydroquinate dehydratase [Olsenella sp. KH3B4]|uniref:type II 3-dehydroquinate dehydratase n=1 Tax=Olsenella sp. KH3B4 TaxID=1855394 RepID=UPI0008BA77F8|nr:type II 3-dehydroquinate dehydratase [Olsenella sp. KH3B4]SES62303.1 3-dehydroquinate dehydratase [Olsenella sp. KH3B4]